MLIAGLQKTTLVDYPGKVACTVFTPGCNFRCGYCHNPSLVSATPDQAMIPEDEFLAWLSGRKKWLDGVCVTGGEPTLQVDLPQFAAKVKELGFLFKLDTNGSNPKMLSQMLDYKLVDFVAMDIKGPLENYKAIANVNVDLEAIKKSIEMIRTRAPDYEFRTTVAPDWYSNGDAAAIGKWLDGSKAYYLQNFLPNTPLNPAFSSKLGFSPDRLEELAEILKPHFGHVGIR